jgi:anti-anti-sigma regulatory factor
MVAIATKAGEQVLFLEGQFDAAAFCRIRERIRKATTSTPITLSFRDVHFCDPFALGKLFEEIADSDGAVLTQGLSHHHDVLLGYLGHTPL